MAKTRSHNGAVMRIGPRHQLLHWLKKGMAQRGESIFHSWRDFSVERPRDKAILLHSLEGSRGHFLYVAWLLYCSFGLQA